MSAGDFEGVVRLLPADWAGRRVSVEWTDCQKHVGCEPEWMATAETLSNDRPVASAMGSSMMDALKNLELALSKSIDE
jgi:hypothetical protein